MTVLGGPHTRCYPEDAGRYFDYVLGFTDRTVIREVLSDGAPHRPAGRRLAALRQPTALPGLRERWKFVAPTLRKAPILKLVPMLGSFGCPYTCSFCIDSAVPYQPLDLDGLKEDLRFLAQQVRRPRVGWHDPNFGVRFDNTLDAIEEAAPPGSIDFIAETALSLLSEPHVKRWINVVRAVSSEGFGRIRHYTEVRRLDTDRQLRSYFEQEAEKLPDCYVEKIRRDLGPLWGWLPGGALYHDHNAYLRSEAPAREPLLVASSKGAQPKGLRVRVHPIARTD